jgi:hypothetical protein
VRTVEHYFEPYGGYSPSPPNAPARHGCSRARCCRCSTTR